MAKGDMPKMLSALATMRSSVDSLVNVPEFVGVSDKVAMLETRVKELSVPKLADAIDRKQGDCHYSFCNCYSANHDCDAMIPWGQCVLGQ